MPPAVVMSASEIPAATTANPPCPVFDISPKADMIPSTVPKSPTNGAVAPTVARIQSARRSRHASSWRARSTAAAARPGGEHLPHRRPRARALEPRAVELAAPERGRHGVAQLAGPLAEAPQGDGTLHRDGHRDHGAGDDDPEGDADVVGLQCVGLHALLPPRAQRAPSRSTILAPGGGTSVKPSSGRTAFTSISFQESSRVTSDPGASSRTTPGKLRPPRSRKRSNVRSYAPGGAGRPGGAATVEAWTAAPAPTSSRWTRSAAAIVSLRTPSPGATAVGRPGAIGEAPQSKETSSSAGIASGRSRARFSGEAAPR